jgi:hypothetical protein
MKIKKLHLKWVNTYSVVSNDEKSVFFIGSKEQCFQYLLKHELNKSE